MTPLRPIELIRRELQTALDFQQRYTSRSTTDPLVARMRADNEEEIHELRSELAQALAGDVEISLDGAPVEDHRIALPFFARVMESLQATYRAVFKSLAPDGRLRRGDATLAIAGTAPGSFKVALTTPAAQLDLLADPVVDRAMAVIIDLLRAAETGSATTAGATWASQTDEPAVRAMIRLSSTLASSHGTTRVRWRQVSGEERIVAVAAESARSLAAALAGEAGREIVTLTGHLQMAQDQPPRVRLRTTDDAYLASVTSPEMLSRVKELLFDEVRATVVIDMKTSPSTGSPDTEVELMDLEPA